MSDGSARRSIENSKCQDQRSSMLELANNFG